MSQNAVEDPEKWFVSVSLQTRQKAGVQFENAKLWMDTIRFAPVGIGEATTKWCEADCVHQ